MSADALSVEGTAQLCVSGWLHVWHRYQFRQLSEVLGGCCEEELVTGTFRPSQSQTIQLEDAFEVSEQHLDFFAQSSRGSALIGLCDFTRDVASAFVD